MNVFFIKSDFRTVKFMKNIIGHNPNVHASYQQDDCNNLRRLLQVNDSLN